jgi:hypothetical protein
LFNSGQLQTDDFPQARPNQKSAWLREATTEGGKAACDHLTIGVIVEPVAVPMA